MMPILAIIGTSGSGKTNLIEYLITHLSKEKIKLATIKHIHHSGFTVNAEGKDTWRHSKAGAKIVISIAPEEIAIIKRREGTKMDLERILDLVRYENPDLLILEGFHSLIAKRSDVYKIVTAKDEKDLWRTLEGTVEPILAVTGPLANKKKSLTELSIPFIDIDNDEKKVLRLIKGMLPV